MAESTQFHGVLPPGDRASLASSFDGANGLIRWALTPLQGELNAALALCDQERALCIAYDALSRVADALTAMHGDTVLPDQLRVHALLVQLLLLPPESQFDGTLADSGMQVEISYRNWAIASEEAAAWTQRLMQHCQSLWPGAWVAMLRQD